MSDNPYDDLVAATPAPPVASTGGGAPAPVQTATPAPTPSAADLLARQQALTAQNPQYPHVAISPGEAEQMARDLAAKNGTAATGKPDNLPNPYDQLVASATPPDFVKGMGAALTHGATFGLNEPIAAGLIGGQNYVGNLLSGGPSKSFGDFYNEQLEKQRSQRQAFEANSPIAGTLGEVAGGFAAVPAKAVAAIQAAPSLANQAWQGLKTGSVFGALNGFGNAEGGLQDRLWGAGEGSLLGGGFGALAPVALAPLGNAWNGLKGMVSPFTHAGQENIAGNVLNEAAGGRTLAPQPAPLPNMTPTTGQATNDPGLLWLERSVGQGSPAAKALSEEARTGNNQAIRGAVGQVGDLANSESAPATMRSALDSAKTSVKTSASAKFKQVDPNDASWIPMQPFKDAVGQYIKELPKALHGAVPSDILDVINNKFGRVESFDELQALRSSLGGAQRGAAVNDPNKARIIGDIKGLLDKHLEDLPGVPPDMLERSQEARTAWREYVERFQNPDVRKTLAKDSQGFARTPESATADQFIKSGRGGPEAWSSFLNAVKGTPQEAQALDAARSTFAKKFLDAASSQVPDQAGDQLILAGKANKFIQDYWHVINSPLFTDAQRELINSIGKGADMASRTARAGASGGSDTYAKLSGGSFIDAMIGKWPARMLTTGAGAAMGYALEGGPVGAVGGALLGETKGGDLLDKLYSAPREKVMKIIEDAIHDPALAQALTMKANAASTQLWPARVWDYFNGLLGGQVGEGVRKRIAA